ncbi:hypothetical protein AKJ09_03646 [Labilithrix luteola]|uniref:Uncharacterized protein n=1 Tax=Labilithrix luteola TaxID=1391654 RepID=A0A0K1PTY7_9BACT|nr:hypothetical protein AKJ09_03646 [Labilithrix luteola]
MPYSQIWPAFEHGFFAPFAVWRVHGTALGHPVVTVPSLPASLAPPSGGDDDVLPAHAVAVTPAKVSNTRENVRRELDRIMPTSIAAARRWLETIAWSVGRPRSVSP